VLGDGDFLAAELGLVDVLNFVVVAHIFHSVVAAVDRLWP
jgi:hypothetical protein